MDNPLRENIPPRTFTDVEMPIQGAVTLAGMKK
jgi:hypothetical protein